MLTGAESSATATTVGVVVGVMIFGYFVVWRGLPLYKTLWRKHRTKASPDGTLPDGPQSPVTEAARTRVSAFTGRGRLLIYALIGTSAISLTLIFVALYPHSHWLGWFGLIDLVLLASGFLIFRRPRTQRRKIRL